MVYIFIYFNIREAVVVLSLLYFNNIIIKTMSVISENIRKLRQKKGISQDKLSKLADISLNTVIKIELAQSPNPTIKTIQKVAKALEVSIDELVN
jgi:DNA-binding XRE family transcriptional regulator